MTDGTDAGGRRGPGAAGAAVVVVVLAVAVGGLVQAGVAPAVVGGGWSLDGIAGDRGGTPIAATPDTPTPAPLPPGDRLAGVRSLADADVVVAGGGADELGYAAAVGDVNGDGTPDVVLGAPLYNASGSRSGAVFVFFGPVAPGKLSVADADVTLAGASRGDWAGNSVAVADVTGDGVGDLVVGAPRNGGAGRNAGAVYVVPGGRNLSGTVALGSAGATLAGAAPGSLAGYSVAAGNVTGDGAADVVVGAPRGEGSPGRVFVVDGRRAAAGGSLGDADAVLTGERVGDEAGWRVAVAGDVIGDGGPTVIVGAPRNDAAGENAGAAYVVAAPFDGNRSLGDAGAVLRGPEAGALAGWSVAAPGDVAGDGRPDVFVGAPFAGRAGAAYLVVGGVGERSLAAATTLRGAAPGDQAGWVVGGAGDVTCDGRPDLLVGAPGNDVGGADAGAVHVASGAGPADLANASATLVGAAAGDEVGHADALAAIPGRNATGLVVGAPFGDAPPTAHVVYVACPDR